MVVDWISYAYSASIAAGGLAGYLKAGSTASLGAGLLFGGLAGLGAYRSSKDPSDVYLSLGISGALGGLMGQRFINSGKFMPAGLIASLSVCMVARCVYTLTTRESSPSQGKSE